MILQDGAELDHRPPRLVVHRAERRGERRRARLRGAQRALLAMCVVLIVGVCQPSFLEKAMALLQRSKSKHADVNVNRV